MRFLLNGDSLVEAGDDIKDAPPYEGRGVFETMRGVAGRIPWLERHFGRLRRSSERLGCTLPFERLRGELLRTLAEIPFVHARIRVCLGAHVGGDWRLWGQVLPLGGSENNLVVGVMGGHPGADAPMVGLKVLGHQPFLSLAERARAAGWDEALLLDSHGQIIEGTRTNVFALTAEGSIVTPPLAAGPLPGVARAWVMEQLKALGEEVREAPLRPHDLSTAREIWVCNSVMGVRRIERLDGSICASPVDRSLASHLDAEFRREMGL